MTSTIKVLLGLCLLVVVFGSIKVVEHYQDEGRSPYEKLEEELEQKRTGGGPASIKDPIDRIAILTGR